MRSPHFITQHRGGLLSAEHHRALMRWAVSVVRHAFEVLHIEMPESLRPDLEIAIAWTRQECKAGACMLAARRTHALARERQDEVMQNLLRAAGHAMATAHMADHAVGAALYTRIAFLRAQADVSAECAWQEAEAHRELAEIAHLTLALLEQKQVHMRALRSLSAE